MFMFEICNILITIPTSITKIKLIDFNHLIYKLFNIIPSIGNLDFNVKVTFNRDRLGDRNLVDRDPWFIHLENKIQEKSVTVKLFLKLFFAAVDFFGVNLASDRVQFSPEFADFDGSFHTSSINLP
jgi:hypothetical protein